MNTRKVLKADFLSLLVIKVSALSPGCWCSIRIWWCQTMRWIFKWMAKSTTITKQIFMAINLPKVFTCQNKLAQEIPETTKYMFNYDYTILSMTAYLKSSGEQAVGPTQLLYWSQEKLHSKRWPNSWSLNTTNETFLMVNHGYIPQRVQSTKVRAAQWSQR